MLIIRFLLKELLNTNGNLFPHLGGSCFRKCNNQKFVNILWIFFIRHFIDYAFDKNSRFSGTGCCGNQNIRISFIYCFLLSFSPSHFISPDSSLSKCISDFFINQFAFLIGISYKPFFIASVFLIKSTDFPVSTKLTATSFVCIHRILVNLT